jgi:hypothetical protein
MVHEIEFTEGHKSMRETKRYNKIIIIISFIVILLLVCYWLYSKWQKEKNIFVYEEHLDDIVVTVGEKPVTLREFGYYIVKMESDVQEKALIYNPQDPMEYWNVHFSAGLDSGFMFEYAWNYALADCVCDLIFSKKAQEAGYSLSEDGYKKAKIQADIILMKGNKPKKHEYQIKERKRKTSDKGALYNRCRDARRDGSNSHAQLYAL